MRVVTIDGPAGAGKSTVARGVAEALGWCMLDTGAMYRAVTLAALRRGVDPDSWASVAAVAERLTVLVTPGRVLMDGEDVTVEIRSAQVGRAIGAVADNPGVRERLVAWQRAFAARRDTVTEGRDQGTIVFPDAFRKFFLTASIEERALRRAAELRGRGESPEPDEVLEEIRRRDARDEARAIAPLRPARDAMIIDTSGKALEEVIGLILDEVRARLTGAPA